MHADVKEYLAVTVASRKIVPAIAAKRLMKWLDDSFDVYFVMLIVFISISTFFQLLKNQFVRIMHSICILFDHISTI